MNPEPWRPAASHENLRHRAALLGDIRRYFAGRDVTEVETPLMVETGVSDPAIEQFSVMHGSSHQPVGWLRTSPEYAMKRLLASGFGDCYELGRVFRSDESGRLHSAEFTLLEWYRLGWSCHRLMDEVVDLLGTCSARFGRQWRPRKYAYRTLFMDIAGIDPITADTAQLAECAEAHGVVLSAAGTLDRDAWLDVLMTHVVQPGMDAESITLVHDYPASQAALARLKPGHPDLAERFEVFLGGTELANGYRELTDAADQRQRFDRERQRRLAAGQTDMAIDTRLLEALAAGLPECSGVALGVDRLLMVLLGSPHIQDVIAFPGP